jgi:hypothetical protein
MAENDCAWRIDFFKSAGNEVGLCFGCPDCAAGPLAVTKSRSVKGDHAVFFRCQIDQPAGFKVLDHAAVAMQEDQRSSRPPLNVVEAQTVHCYESSERRVPPFSFMGKPPVKKRRRDCCCSNADCDWKSLLRQIRSGNGAGWRSRKMHG